MYFETHRDKEIFYSQADNYCQAHFHRSVELLYVTKGEKTIFLNGKEYRLCVGDLLVCPPYSLHAFPPSERSEQIVTTVPANVCPNFEKLCNTQAPETPVFHDQNGEIASLIKKLKNCKNDILFSGLVNYILGIYTENTHFYPIKERGERSFIERVIAYIDEYYMQPIPLSAIAKCFGYTPNYFSALFKKYFYASFIEYLNGVRIQKSLPLLETHAVSSVYFLCGFNSPQQYFLHFKKFYGCSPKQFLKTNTK